MLRQDGAKKKKKCDRKQGRREQAESRLENWNFCRKGTGQERYDWNPCHPPQSINSNTPTQMMHENPFMLQARSEDNTGGGREKEKKKEQSEG